jgi:hypothetical protein
MKHYVIHTAEGVIRFAGNCPDDATPPDHSDEGLTTLVLAAPRPAGEWHVAGGVLQSGRLDLRTLEQRRADKWAELKAARAAAEAAPLATPYGTFDCDAVSQARIANAALLMQTQAAELQPGAMPTIDFTLYDNSSVTLTAGQMVEVALRMGAQVQAAFATGRALREALDAAQTAEAVSALAWPG